MLSSKSRPKISVQPCAHYVLPHPMPRTLNGCNKKANAALLMQEKEEEIIADKN